METNNISIQNVIEQIVTNEKPSPEKRIDIEFEVMTLWTRKDMEVSAKGQSRVLFVSPSGEIKDTPIRELDLLEYISLRSKLHVYGISIPEEGRYNFLIEYRANDQDEWQQVAKVPLRIIYDPDFVGRKPLSIPQAELAISN